MLTLHPDHSELLVIDFQSRLMPAIDQGASVVANAQKLLIAARRLQIPVLFTEQNPRGLGATLPALAPTNTERVVQKMTFDAMRTKSMTEQVSVERAAVVIGCEAHVCVLQTVLGLLSSGRKVFVVSDAIGSRISANHHAALARMAHHGAELVTTEMALFEWLGSAEHPAFREILALVK
jgi:nicotinamidase-related amidase